MTVNGDCLLYEGSGISELFWRSQDCFIALSVVSLLVCLCKWTPEGVFKHLLSKLGRLAFNLNNQAV